MTWTFKELHFAIALNFGLHWFAGSTVIDHFAGPNFALQRTASQTPDGYYNYHASLAVDGNTDNDFRHDSCSHTDGKHNTPASWTVNFNQPLFVKGIIIFNRQQETYGPNPWSQLKIWDRLKNFRIYGDENRLLYDDYSKNKYNALIISIPINSSLKDSSLTIWIPGRTSYTVDDGKSYLTLCEVMVYAEVCETPVVSNRVVLENVEQYYYLVGSSVNIHCKTGYTLVGNKLVTCVSDMQWSNLPYCSLVHCPNPGTFENGYYLPLDNCSSRSLSDLFYGCRIQPHCNDGFKLQTDFTRTCDENGNWSTLPPACVIVTCDHPGSFSHGQYLKDGGVSYISGPSNYGTFIETKCEEGYIISDTKQRACSQDGTWSGDEPKCNIVHCSFQGLGALTSGNYMLNGHIFDDGFATYMETVGVVCIKGYKQKSDTENATCRSNGTWSSHTSTCVIVTCLTPAETANMKFKTWYNSSYGTFTNALPIGAFVEAICQTGDLKNGSRIRLCKDDGTWDGSEPVCEVESTEIASHSSAAAVGGAVGGSVVVIIIGVVVVIIIIIYRKRKHLSKPEQPGANKYSGLRKSKSNTGEYAEISETDVIRGSETEQVINLQEKTLSEGRKSSVSIEQNRTEQQALQPSNGVYANAETESTNNAYYSFSAPDRIPKGAILVENLSDIVLSGETAIKRFEKEFENFPEGLTEKHSEAVKLQNRGKNRYRNMYAYDETRVVLLKEYEEESDYINACYVHGFEENRAYIASQGPTHEILVDFWKMIWQTESSKIVMLTKLIEQDKAKCEQYWPDTGSIEYGSVHVSLEAFDIYSDFAIRTLKIKKNGQKARIVKQFHYTAWPDKGVPKYASSLVQFRNKVINSRSSSKGPVVVHCSAGVGRTGTFIALDFLTKQAKETGYVDVVGTVMALRKQRVNLVQTLEQYVLIHHALVETLMLSTSALPSSKLPETYQNLLEIDRETGIRKLDREFEMLKKLSPVTHEDQYVSAKLVRNRNKNRYSNILPVEEFMPCLSVEKSRVDEYINAVFLSSYKENRAFIITQTPLENTKEDFWKLVWKHSVHSIVMMNHVSEMQESEIFWPEAEKTCRFSGIDVSTDSIMAVDDHLVVSMTAESNAERRCIKLIQCGGWTPGKSLPDSPQAILTLMELVQTWQQRTGNKKVLVHCMNGAEKSGLFCVVSAVIDRMKIEQDVAISHVIEDMRNARKQIIPSVEQYQFCYEAVLTYIQQNETYSNFTL